MSEKHFSRVLEYAGFVVRNPSVKLFSQILLILLGIGVFFYSSERAVNEPPPSQPTSTIGEEQASPEALAQVDKSQPVEPVATPDRQIAIKQAANNSEKMVQPVQDPPVVKQSEEQTNEAPEMMQPRAELAEAGSETAGDKKEGEKIYYKISHTGERLHPGAEGWACVQDETTRLMWEAKTDDGGLHDSKSLYSWYEPAEKGKAVGLADGGRCKGGVDCDTHAFVQAINAERLCGYSDWRLPTREEMTTLVAMGDGGTVMINPDYFPRGLGSWYWTATSNEKYPEYAWYLLFRNGMTLSDVKERAKHVRLVRSDGRAG